MSWVNTVPTPASAFGRYAGWYDLFNEGKDYAVEIRHVLTRVAAHGQTPRRCLDVGCGTGRHLASLAAMGIAVEGVDRSAPMVARAHAAWPDIPFHVGTAQDFQLSGAFDLVTMLFHVMSYQTSDEQVRGALANARGHLLPGGVLAFDFWHTSGVLGNPPERRVRETSANGRRLFRVASPAVDLSAHRVDIEYTFRWDSPDAAPIHAELHSMRYFDRQELERFLGEEQFEILTCEAWMEARPLRADDWYGFICARRPAMMSDGFAQ